MQAEEIERRIREELAAGAPSTEEAVRRALGVGEGWEPLVRLWAGRFRKTEGTISPKAERKP